LEPDSTHCDAGECAPTTTDTASSQGQRPIRKRTGGFFDRIGVRVVSLALSGFYLALILAALWRPDFRTDSRLHSGLSLLAFYIDTFAFHGGVAAAVLVVASAFARRWLLCVAGLPAVLFTVGPAAWCYLPHEPPAVSGNSITVMSANLFGPNRRHDALVREIAEADPDVLLVQEYTYQWRESINAALGDRYPHVSAIPRSDCFGMAVYSKIPFADGGPARVSLDDLNLPCMKATLRLDDRLVTFFNVHLVPPKSPESFRRLGAQLADLLDAAAAEPHPVVLAGDFNSTRRSRLAAHVRRFGLTGCHEQAGWGRGSTWPVLGMLRYVPGLRIDHVYLSADLSCTSCRTGVGEGSDHRPIVAVIGLAPLGASPR